MREVVLMEAQFFDNPLKLFQWDSQSGVLTVSPKDLPLGHYKFLADAVLHLVHMGYVITSSIEVSE